MSVYHTTKCNVVVCNNITLTKCGRLLFILIINPIIATLLNQLLLLFCQQFLIIVVILRPIISRENSVRFCLRFWVTISVRRPKSYTKCPFLTFDFQNREYDFHMILVKPVSNPITTAEEAINDVVSTAASFGSMTIVVVADANAQRRDMVVCTSTASCWYWLWARIEVVGGACWEAGGRIERC
jgi:hypothetical protein